MGPKFSTLLVVLWFAHSPVTNPMCTRTKNLHFLLSPFKGPNFSWNWHAAFPNVFKDGEIQLGAKITKTSLVFKLV